MSVGGGVELMALLLMGVGAFVFHRARQRRWLVLSDLGLIVALLMFAWVTCRTVGWEFVRGQGSSMLPTLPVEGIVVVDKSAYGIRWPVLGSLAVRRQAPHRDDIAVLISPVEGSSEWLLKRVIGVPGDRIRVEVDGRVWVNGRLNETLPSHFDGAEPAQASVWTAEAHQSIRAPDIVPRQWELKNDEYFVAGDNRRLSYDSRVFGPVSQSMFIGPVVGRWSPIERWRSRQ